MRCPGCGGKMFAAEWNGVEADCCSACAGIWLDRGEYEALSGGQSLPVEPLSAARSASKRRCPACGFALAAGRPTTTGLTVDFCPNGHGMYFDKGELAAILAGTEQSGDSALAGYLRKFNRSGSTWK